MAAVARTAHLQLLASPDLRTRWTCSIRSRKQSRVPCRCGSGYGIQTPDFGRAALIGLESRRPRRGRRHSSSTAARASASTAPAAAAAGGSSARSLWHSFVAKYLAAVSRVLTQVQKIQLGPVGGSDIVAMVRLLLLGCTAVVAYVASKRAWGKIREHAAGKGDGGGGSPMQVLARGATCVQSNMGPWSLEDFTLGLAAMAKVTEKEPPAMPGKEVEAEARDAEFLMRAQHWRAQAESAYVQDSGSFSLFSHLPESAIVACEWQPCQDSFRPAYVVFVDAPMGAVVLAVRGTSHVIDMLLNSGTSPEPFCDGTAHGGFAHASNVLFEQALPHLLKAFEAPGGRDKKLVITGHSMGAAVGAMCGLRLRDRFPDLECWAFCPPACLSLELARDCAEFTTSFVAAHDLVPRFSLASVENLRERIGRFDWDHAEAVARDDADWQNIKKALDAMRSCQRAQAEAVKLASETGQQVKESRAGQTAKDVGSQVAGSDAGQKVKAWGQTAYDRVADSDVADKVKGAGKQAKDYIEGNENRDEQDEKQQNSDPMPPLYPPGRLLVLGCDPPGCGKMPQQRSDVATQRNYGTYPTFDEAQSIRWIMHEAQQEDLAEIVVSPWCISDHMLGNMCEAIGYFQAQCPPAMGGHH
ncbi:sn1-specific diacylglycerol lipase [Marchantia polymorpha subsp. ruderalis]|nr:hypothetical protein MARPO_0124s0004 [Marchantia polymorpha]BBN10390.1 hypothetical protein Mp_5g03190 [Marchantia polymorpha subsp. ruderalis]|eukprot:PTQ30427.1 hypothetical protein MARPO_0124s0004 [Marchantia polymorpha]